MSGITIIGDKVPSPKPQDDKRDKFIAFIAGIVVGFLAALVGLTGGI